MHNGSSAKTSPFEKRKALVGVQLYSVRDQCKSDLPGTLAALSKIGYTGIEFAGYYERNAADLRQLLDGLGLATCGTHTPYESILPANLAATIDFNQTLGNQFIIIPWMTGRTRQDWLEKADLFNEVATRLKPYEMFVGYHAHEHDFKTIDGESAWNIFFQNTIPEVVMQLDTGNCLEGGADPLKVLNNFPGRAASIHLQAHGGGPEAVIGEDKVDWRGVFDFCQTKGGTQWYVVEHETSRDPIHTLTRSFAFLREMVAI